jgi:DNA-binding beta-propeller fold protein YncE
VGLWQENVSPQRATYIDRRVDEQGRIVEAFYFEESRLVVLNVDGAIVDTVVGVRRYAWDPTAGRIVYITGAYREGGFGFTTTGTWTHDLSSKRSERIHSGGVDVQWARWDGSIYIYDPSSQGDSGVLRFDPQTRALAATSRKGIHFSPDGTYYYAQGSEGAGLEVFRTEDDALVQVDLGTPEERTRWAQPSGWLDEKTLIAKVQASDYLYDVETKTTQRATGTVVPLRSRNSRMFLLEGSAVVQRAKSEFEVLR